MDNWTIRLCQATGDNSAESDGGTIETYGRESRSFPCSASSAFMAVSLPQRGIVVDFLVVASQE
jgi:hypothetical protein